MADSNMNEDLMVTIRCLVYNHEPYIRQCLEGFVMQKTNFRFEAIVHDDASTDGSAVIIQEYAEKYPEIIKPIFETENQYSKKDGSLSRIMNNHTRGKYIAICEGDDYWIDPFKLQKQVQFLESNPDYSLCFHNAVEFYDDIDKAPRFFCPLVKSKDVNLDELTNSWIVPTASMLYRKEVVEDYPSWTRKIYSGDLTLQLIAYSKGKIFYIKDIMSFYRKTYKTESVSTQMKDRLDFVYSQHALLYELYNEYTNKIYDKILTKRIDFCRKEGEFLKLRKKSNIYALLRMPLFSFKKILRRIFK